MSKIIAQACHFLVWYGTPWRSYLENMTIQNKFINKWVRRFIHQTMCQVKKLASGGVRKQPPEVQKNSPEVSCKERFFKKGLQHKCFPLMRFAKLSKTPILKNIWERLLLKMCSWNWEKLNFIIRSFNFTLKNRFFQYQYQKKVHDRYFMIVHISWSLYLHTIIFLWCGKK